MAKIRAIEPSEAVIQATVVQHLEARGRPDMYWFHVPNGEHRHAATGAKLKKMGVKAGVPDLVLVIGGKAIFLELKRNRGRVSTVQSATKVKIEMAGGEWRIAYGLDAALSELTAIGAFLGGAATRRKAA